MLTVISINDIFFVAAVDVLASLMRPMGILSAGLIVVVAIGLAITGRAEAARKLITGSNEQMPGLTSIDSQNGTLAELSIEFESVLWRVKEKPTFFNLVDLCGATRTCWHRTLGEWATLPALDTELVEKMRNLTIASQLVIEDASKSVLLKQWQKEQVKGMAMNATHRIELYVALLNQNLTPQQKEIEFETISKRMLAEQTILQESSEARGR